MNNKRNNSGNMNLYRVNSMINDHRENDFTRNKIINGVNRGVYEYIKYLKKAKNFLSTKNAIEIPFEIKKTKVTKNNGSTKEELRLYILFEKIKALKLKDKIENGLFENQDLILYSKPTTGEWKEDKQNEIIVFDINPEDRYLVIKEQVKQLYLKTNTYQIDRQIKALNQLRNNPLPHHNPLQKLFSEAEKSEEYFSQKNTFRLEPEWEILKNIHYDGTKEQRAFVKKALQTDDFALLEGPPGSGKTTAIIELIAQLVKQNKRVLLVSSTHVAVDNVIHRIINSKNENIKKNVVPLRVASKKGTISKESVKQYHLETFVNNKKKDIKKHLNNNNKPSATMLRNSIESSNEFDDIILKSANLVGGTMIGILQHPDIKKGGIQEVFDVMIVDEASKVTFPDFIVPALYAKKWILVGDVKQLSPYSEDDYVNESIDKAVESEEEKQNLIETFELKKKLASEKPFDKETVKVLFTESKECPVQAECVFRLDKNFTPEIDTLKLNSVDVIFCKNAKENQHILSKYLHVKAQFFEGEITNIDLRHKQDAFHKNKKYKRKININNYHGGVYKYEYSSDKKQNWKEIVGSKLAQMYQYRFGEHEDTINNQSKRLKQELDFLVPYDYKEKIETIRRIAFPSILELLQIGVGDKYFENKQAGYKQRDKKLIYSGFKNMPEVITEKFQTLTFQHRMYDEIAETSREYFYNEHKNLQTANTVFKRVDKLLKYKKNEPKAIWVGNNDENFRKPFKGQKQKNINPTEVKDIEKELLDFLDFASKNPNETYEVAVLTFYIQQESELRIMLRKLVKKRVKFKNTSRNFKFFNINNVKITLCTVDKFQGDEADLVLLSFTKFTKGAFYNSPNRLNVALTRARYKLILFGNQTWLKKNSPLEGLRALAENKESRLKA